jgi:murein DD-endopeptidase MepM/ murein hydrolase activator NlpD
VTSPKPHRGRLRLAAGALLVLGLFGLAVPGPVSAGPEETRKELNAARKRVERLEDSLDETRARIDSLRAELQQLNVRISQATTAKEALAAAIDETEEARDRARRQGRRLQVRLDERARSVYIQGPTGAIDLVLGAQSLPDLSDRITFLEVLNRNDADLAAGVAAERATLTKSKANLERYEREKERLLARLTDERSRFDALLLEEQQLRESFAAEFEEAKEEAEKLSDKLAEQLAARYAAVQSAGGSSGPPPSANGPFYWCPVDSPRSYIDDFGFPRVGHTHQGNDIFAPEGTPIRAPFAGTAEEGYDGLGGIVVHVYASANADYVYNAHLSRHAGVDGAHVQPGNLIGYVGNTGNAQGTSPHDHFEYHPGGGSAVSPYLYLNEVCGVGGG